MAYRERSLTLDLKESGETPAWEWDKLPAQYSFLTSPNTFTCMSGGFGCGKTTVLCAKVILLLTTIPNNLGYLGRLDGKALRASTMQSLEEMLPKEWIVKHNDQRGFLQLHRDVGGSKLVYGDFKDVNDLKNIPLGFYAIDQMEEVGQEVWDYLAGRIRRRTPILKDGFRQYYVQGSCPRNSVNTRHYALQDDTRCRLCGESLPPFSVRLAPGEEHPPWDMIIYNRYGFGVANPEGPSHWIYKYFYGLPGAQGLSVGKHDPKTGEKYQAYHATVYDGLTAGFVDRSYVGNLEVLYSHNPTMADRYLHGKWVEAEGLVYPSWNRTEHVFKRNQPRYDDSPVVHEEMGLFEYIDHGLTNPTAVGWVGVEKCTCGCGKNNVYILDCHHEGGKTVSYHAAQIRNHRGYFDHPVQATYLDSQAFSKTLMGGTGTPRENELYSVADEYMDNHIDVVPNQKDWDAGYNRISELLSVDPNHIHPFTGHQGAPHLFVSNHCTSWIEEIETYKWKKLKNSVIQHNDEPQDGRDDHMDGFNGLLTSRPEFIPEYRPPKREYDWEAELDGYDPEPSHMGY